MVVADILWDNSFIVKKQNNFAFIDSQNLNLGVQSQGWKLDWRKFRQYLRDKYFVSKAYLFIGHLDGNESLYTFLQECGYILILKPTLELPDGKVKGNVDAELVLHTMIEFNNFDKAIIVSGDGDFYCLIEHLAETQKLFYLLTPNTHYSSLYRKYVQYIRKISDVRGSLQTKKTGIGGRSKP